LMAFITHGRDEIKFLKVIGIVSPSAAPFLHW
jgi:hypothetical protein